MRLGFCKLLQKKEAQTKAAKERAYITPHYRVVQQEHAYEVRVYLPGVRSEDATVTLERETLLVEAQPARHWDANWRALHREIPDANYRLSLELNLHVDEGSIRAESREGVLTIHLPVAEAARPRRIQIR
jgi:HSP20 family protein